MFIVTLAPFYIEIYSRFHQVHRVLPSPCPIVQSGIWLWLFVRNHHFHYPNLVLLHHPILVQLGRHYPLSTQCIDCCSGLRPTHAEDILLRWSEFVSKGIVWWMWEWHIGGRERFQERWRCGWRGGYNEYTIHHQQVLRVLEQLKRHDLFLKAKKNIFSMPKKWNFWVLS